VLWPVLGLTFDVAIIDNFVISLEAWGAFASAVPELSSCITARCKLHDFFLKKEKVETK
jgi:hypothetical protein